MSWSSDRRTRRVRLVAAAAALAFAGVLAGANGPGRAATAPSALGVRGDEFRLVLSRAKLPPGPARIQFQNAGEDAHDLWIAKVGGTGSKGTGEVEPGAVDQIEFKRLKPRSRYRLWCSLPGHVGYGMEAFLWVKRSRAAG